MAAENTDDLIISISTDLATVRRSLKRLESDIASTSGNVVKQFDKMGRGIDNSMTTALQARIDKMVGIGEKGAKEWTGALADQGKELERLRARYSPLFSTLNNYKQTVADIRRAHAVGAISATEMTAAITRERQAALASTAAIKGRNQALQATVTMSRGNHFQTSNLAAQGFDIASTAAFMPWQTVALQQGPQVAQVFNDIKASGQKIGPAVAGAFLQLVNPISLVTIGTIAASAAAIQYFSNVDWGGGKSEETLKKEAELIAAVTQKWGESLPALKAYNDERQRLAENADIKEAASSSADAQWTDLRKQIDDINIGFTDMASRLAQMGADSGQVGDLQRAFDELASGIEKGSASSAQAKKVQDELLKLVKETGNPEIEAFAKTFDALGVAIDNASGKASKFKTEAAVLVDLVKQLGPLGQLSPIISGDGRFMTDANEIQTYRANQERLRRENENPTVINPDGRRVGVPVPGEKPIRLGDEPNKKAETAAQRAANAYRDLLKSADDRIAQLRLETELTGQYGTATEAARFRLELLQQAEDKGRSLSQEQRAQIEEKVAAYEKYAQALSEAKLQQDLLDKARMAGLSQREQEVTKTLREYGLPEDLGSKNAGLIRDQLRTEEITSAADAFIDDLTGALLSGGDDIGKRLGQVILSALMDSAQQQLSTLLKQVFGALMNGGKGGAVGPAASVVSTLAAPVGKVTRAPLGGNKADFVNALLPSAIQEGARTGVDPRIIVAQAAQETGWGRSAPGNNYFGIKSHGLDGGQSLNTWEVINGKRVNVTDSFRQFASPADSVRGYGDFIMSNPRYAGFRSANGLDAQLSALQSSGYATDPNYSNSVGAIARSIELPSKNASAALEKLAGASTETTKGLGSLASSLASGASGIGGGGFNLASLLSPSFTPNTNIGNYLKGIPGFAKGTDNAPRGLAIVGEDGPELVHFRGGERVIPNKRISAPRAPTLRARSAANGNGAGSNSLTVNINGASGDPHVRELVRQGVQEALAGQSEQMRRGGFGDMQDRYVSQRR